MGRLLVKCEKCGSFYPSGILAEVEDVKHKLKELNTTYTVCAYCTHENITANAKLVIAPALF